MPLEDRAVRPPHPLGAAVMSVLIAAMLAPAIPADSPWFLFGGVLCIGFSYWLYPLDRR